MPARCLKIAGSKREPAVKIRLHRLCMRGSVELGDRVDLGEVFGCGVWSSELDQPRGDQLKCLEPGAAVFGREMAQKTIGKLNGRLEIAAVERNRAATEQREYVR